MFACPLRRIPPLNELTTNQLSVKKVGEIKMLPEGHPDDGKAAAAEQLMSQRSASWGTNVSGPVTRATLA